MTREEELLERINEQKKHIKLLEEKIKSHDDDDDDDDDGDDGLSGMMWAACI